MLIDLDSWWVTGWEWNKKFIIFPRKSDYSNEWLWMEKVYHGTKVVFGPGTPALLEKYVSVKEYTWYCLQEK